MDPRISGIPREARAYQGRGAGLVTRIIACTIDAVVVVAALWLAYAAVNAVVFVVNPRGFQFVSTSFAFNLTAGLVVLVGYLTVAWSATGRSYGDHVMGVRVLDRHGQRVRVPRALVRAVACVVFPLGLLWCAVDGPRRSLQDLLLGTSVRYDWTPRLEQARAHSLSS